MRKEFLTRSREDDEDRPSKHQVIEIASDDEEEINMEESEVEDKAEVEAKLKCVDLYELFDFYSHIFTRPRGVKRIVPNRAEVVLTRRAKGYIF